MGTVHIDKCPVCSKQDLRPYIQTLDYSASKEEFDLVQCNDCSFVFTQDFPDENDIKRYYDFPEYISHSDSKKGFINFLYHLVRKKTLNDKVKLVERVSSHKKGDALLDIGAGNGYFLNAANRKHWLSTGIEKNEGARRFAKENFGLNLQTEDYLFMMPDKKKDVITLWHVMEHLQALNETLDKINKILKDDGTLIVALPNIDSTDALYYKKYWAAYDVPRHLWHFNHNSFSVLVEKHGLEIVEIKPMYFDVFYISMLSEKYKKTFFPFLVGSLRAFSFFMRNLLNKQHIKSSSLIYVLKKKI